ncbi:hypothetical protein ABBQ32_003065 [Trebouxia sp. C0010 RCD-2024]
MTTSLNELNSHLQSVIKELNVLKAAEDIDLTNEDLAWELLSTIEECGSSTSMTEDRVENLLQIQRSIAQTARSLRFNDSSLAPRRGSLAVELKVLPETGTHSVEGIKGFNYSRGSQGWWHDIHDSQSWMQQQNTGTQNCKVSSSHRLGSQYHSSMQQGPRQGSN